MGVTHAMSGGARSGGAAVHASGGGGPHGVVSQEV